MTGQSVLVAMRATIGRASGITRARAVTLATVSRPVTAPIPSRVPMNFSLPASAFLYRLVYMQSQPRRTGRPAGQASTRDELLEAATRLMRQSGLSGAGINEIVRESGAPKGSVYHFFPGGKNQIVTEALELHAARVVAFLEETLSRPRTVDRKLDALFEAYAARLEQAGFRASCPSGTVCLDLDAEMEALRVHVAATFDQYIEAIARHVQIGSPRENRAFAAFILTVIEGAYIRGRAERSGGPFREAGTWLRKLAAA
jgi:TetR/AcrR family transcriptional regulator, lmrAB and yxaGH operons repressor